MSPTPHALAKRCIAIRQAASTSQHGGKSAMKGLDLKIIRFGGGGFPYQSLSFIFRTSMRTKDNQRRRTRWRITRWLLQYSGHWLANCLPMEGGVPSALHITSSRFIGTTFNFYCAHSYQKEQTNYCVTSHMDVLRISAAVQWLLLVNCLKPRQLDTLKKNTAKLYGDALV